MIQDHSRAILYKEKQVLTASPLDRVILVYDAALTGCGAGNMQKALQALSLLRNSLDWEAAPQIAPGLQAIYEYCEERVREKDFETPANILRELRETWVQVRREQQTQTTNTHAGSYARPANAPVGMGALSVAG